MKTARRSWGFTLVELLVVISILGILAALTVPALKNLGKSNVQTGATRQLLDDVARARDLAISQHTTVYMVFLSANFWLQPQASAGWVAALNPAELVVLTNLMASQLSGYTFIAHGALGDQPGNHQWHYLDNWKTLPQGYMIAPWKFAAPGPVLPRYFQDPANQDAFTIYPFTNYPGIPFPVVDNRTVQLSSVGQGPALPCLAFNYLGQLVSPANDRDVLGGGADVPLSQGSVTYPYDAVTKIPSVPATPLPANAVSETPPGNSTNISYIIVHLDPLTGRATLMFHRLQ